MKKRQIIIAIVSIVVTMSLCIFLSNQDPDFIKVSTSDSSQENSEGNTLTPTQNFMKNAGISITCGGAIYIIFYAIPHDYQKANQKMRDEQ